MFDLLSLLIDNKLRPPIP